MADIASIIANIDGYRTYEQNRALDLQNQAAKMVNAQNEQIWDLKRALAQNTPDLFGKLSYLDPQSARQKQLSDQEQLKMASKWANSIKNLAPENRERGYGQFLRAMRGYGIDVSDMPQAYDEGYVNQMAELGIEPETRYTNEQTNARLERQIEAQREARQDEFNKKLAAFDYENNYRTKAATERQAQTDEYIKNLGLDADLTKKLLAASRGINLPDDVKISQINAMTDEYLDPLTTDERRAELLGNIKAYREREQALSELLPPEDKKYASGDLGLVQYMTDRGIALDDALVRVGKMTPEQKVELAGAKAAAEAEGKLPSSIRLEDAKYQNNVGLENIKQAGRTDLANLNNRLAMERDANQNILNMKLEDYKKSLPTENLRQMQEQSQITGIPVDEIARQELQDKQLEAARKNADIELKQAQIKQAEANINKINREAKTAGMTTQMLNDIYLQQHPERVDSPAFKGGTNVTVNTGDMTGGVDAATLGKENAKNLARDLEEYGNMVSKMPELEATVQRLKELAPVATYTKAGRARDIIRQEMGRPTVQSIARDEYESIIANQILPLLRDTFGAQFTEREGNSLKATLGDPNKSAESKVKVLDAFINQKRKSIESKARKIEMSQGSQPIQEVVVDFTEL